MRTNKIEIDINKPIRSNVYAIELDELSNEISFLITKNTIPMSLKDKKVRIVANKPDGTQVFDDCNIVNAEEGLCRYSLAASMLTCQGIVECQLVIYGSNGSKLSTPKFKIDVDEYLLIEEDVEVSNEYKSLTEGLKRLDKLIEGTTVAHEHENKGTLDYLNSNEQGELTFMDKKVIVPVEDVLSSENTDTALSSNQGKVLNEKIIEHTDNEIIHVTQEEREKWNDTSNIDTIKELLDKHTENSTIHNNPKIDETVAFVDSHKIDNARHISNIEREKWNNKADVNEIGVAIQNHSTKGHITIDDKITIDNSYNHINNQEVHLNIADKQKWNNKVDTEQLERALIHHSSSGHITPDELACIKNSKNHYENNYIHITEQEKITWNSKANGVHNHKTSEIVGLADTLATKSDVTHKHSLSSLNEVSINTPNKNDILTFNGVAWVAQPKGTSPIVEDNLNSTSATNSLSANQGKILNEKIADHIEKDSHIHEHEREQWNNKVSSAELIQHIDNPVHITLDEREQWNNKLDKEQLNIHTTNTDVHINENEKVYWNSKLNREDLLKHETDTTCHVTSADKDKWNSKLEKTEADERYKGFKTIKTPNGDIVADTFYSEVGIKTIGNLNIAIENKSITLDSSDLATKEEFKKHNENQNIHVDSRVFEKGKQEW